ncbi:MAG: hypothetical protein IIB04_02245 [Acidobacteria bacterium]|nr:hypothetical protein [Acidobacteriota bacterium]
MEAVTEDRLQLSLAAVATTDLGNAQVAMAQVLMDGDPDPLVGSSLIRSDDEAAATGVLVAPGTYSVAMHIRENGVSIDSGQIQTFEVVSIREPTLPGSTQEQRIAYSRQVDELKRSVDGTIRAIDEVIVQLDAIKDVLQNSTADESLYAQAHSLHQRVQQQRDRLEKNETLAFFGAEGPMAITDRLWHAAFHPSTSAYGPTDTQRQSYKIARDEYAGISMQLTQLVDRDYAALKDTLNDSSVPWTPGRGIQK